MRNWFTAQGARDRYAGNRGNRVARLYSRFWATVFGLGLGPRRWVTLEVTGRRSGRTVAFPLATVELDGQRFLVSMLGECNWVRNVRAADGQVVLRHRRRRRCRLTEVPVEQRAAVLRRFVQVAPGARPHVPVDRHAPAEAFAAVAARHPVFRVDHPTGPAGPTA